MKLKIISAAALLALSFTTYANSLVPTKCPGSDTIANVGLENNVVEQDNAGKWVAGKMKSKYDTEQNWTFVLSDITAANAADAYNKATTSLSSLQFIRGPFYARSIRRWACVYTTGPRYNGVAVTPELPGSLSTLASFAK